MSEFKDTLNILSTPFEMKANLPTKEPEIQAEWLANKVYQKVLDKNKHNDQKILHDGPPYANGSIHCGHALNKILKDIIVRYWNMNGFYSEYIPGWDTHGMPIEHALIKKGVNTDKALSIVQKRVNCRDFALEQVEIQKKQFARLGLLTDFSKTYKTLDPEFESSQLEVFFKAYNEGLVYQDLKPVYWSWSSQTALAEAEVEYADETSPSIYMIFPVITPKGELKVRDLLLIWTTTPWTIPSNLAIAVNPNIDYCRVQVGERIYVISRELFPVLVQKLEWVGAKILSTFKGNSMEYTIYQHPLYDIQSPVICAEYVSDSDGTGLVHNAPGFGQDDYLACKKYGIKPYAPVNAVGKFTDESIDKDIVGRFYKDANEDIINKLKICDALVNLSYMSHSVACDWRTKKPVMYRATKQWFIDISKIRLDMLNAIKDVWFPSEINKQQLTDMINNRTEWCISRQRYWGVPIPVIYDENDNPITDRGLANNILDILKREGTNVWFEQPVEYFLTEQFKNVSGCRKETDIMDVWFDSGTTFNVLKKNNLQYPAELYLEGKDQFRGWFNSSLINSVIDSKQAPYKKLLGCGFVLDEKGNKMSKSLGNVIDPNKICEQYGADVLRLWVASSNYKADVRIGDNILKQVSETYRRIRNTLFKFIMSNISDFNYSIDANEEYSELDSLILTELNENIRKINIAYEEFDFISVVDIINNHTLELSAWYFDLIKDSLYCDEKQSPKRRAIQTVLYQIFRSYLIALTPIIPHTCEEAYKTSNLRDMKESIMLEDWILSKDIRIERSLKWDTFFKVKDVVFAKLEELRKEGKIKKNSQANVKISFNNTFEFTNEELVKYLNVAQVEIIHTPGSFINCEASSTFHLRCERCWNFFPKEEINEEHICPRCAKVIKHGI